MNTPAQIVMALLGGGGVFGVVVAVINLISSKDVRKAEVAESLSKTAASLVEPLREQLAETQAQLALQQREQQQAAIRQQQQLDRMTLALTDATDQIAEIAKALPTLVHLAEVVIPIIEFEHPSLAAELGSAAQAAQQALIPEDPR